MQLIVKDERGDFGPQTHAYAEYRAFSGLVICDGPAEAVTVTLARRAADAAEDEGTVVCTIRAEMASGEVVKARAVARHAYAAIDGAVSLVRQGRRARARDRGAHRLGRGPGGHDAARKRAAGPAESTRNLPDISG
jgi:ribosome-associated translation inhibitor RaiA